MLRFIPPSPRGRVLATGLLLATAAAIGLTRWINASDHRDSALLAADQAADIADVYTFRSPVNPSNVVLAMTVSGFIPPSEASTTFFDPNVLYQWKIDNNGDAVEDLAIQAFVTGSGRRQNMHFRVVDRVKHREEHDDEEDDDRASVRRLQIPTVRVTTGPTPIIATRRGIKAFAGVRDDPFFFDLAQFKKIVGGMATSFNNPGTDAFAGTNVLAIVIELPGSMLGAAKVGVWGTTSRRQS
ncbi:MAG TPA: DUF4331 family protein [Gemmatimonadales bacterium]|nr:DUF4331 family protein [Gemmatimonadales bacterium]HYT82964.1 DUF4331 family protein [Gemmatimonadales bacterium]